MNVLITNHISILNRNFTNSNVIALYPQSILKSHIIVLRRKDSFRPILQLNILATINRAWYHIGFMICGMIMLYFLRRGDLMLQNNFTSAYIDVVIAIFGGGNLRYRNKLEKIFFGFLLLAAFYINTICVENLLYADFLIKTPERIDTFDKLAKLNPIICQYNMGENDSAIQEIRFAINFNFFTFCINVHLFRKRFQLNGQIKNYYNNSITNERKTSAVVANDYFVQNIENYVQLGTFEVDTFPENFGKFD